MCSIFPESKEGVANNILYRPDEPEERFILFSFPSSLAILCRPRVGVFFVVEMSTRHSPDTLKLRSQTYLNFYLPHLPFF